jgi:hypothetical protein
MEITLTSVWHQEHLWNFCVLQRVHLSILVISRHSLHDHVCNNITAFMAMYIIQHTVKWKFLTWKKE